MAKKKSTIKKVVETVESWVGMGPGTDKKKAKTAAPKGSAKTTSKRKKKTAKKKTAKKKR
jgi:hypothetical protein